MNDADVLRSLNQLGKIMDIWVVGQDPVIKPVLKHASGPNWLLTLKEVWPTQYKSSSSTKLDDCVEWTATSLGRSDVCRRLSENVWSFKSKQDAEKFLTMFYIRWTE